MPRVNPPAPPITGNVFRFIWSSVVPNSVCQTTHDYMSASLSLPSHLFMVDALDAFIEATQESYLDCLTGKSNLFSVSVACLTQPTVLTIVRELGNNPGVAAGVYLPIEVCAVMRRQSLLKGAHGRGRFSMPAVPTGFTNPALSPNQLDALGITAYQALCSKLNQPLAGGLIGAMKPVVFTAPTGLPGFVPSAALIDTQYPTNYLGTVRRRKPFRGI